MLAKVSQLMYEPQLRACATGLALEIVDVVDSNLEIPTRAAVFAFGPRAVVAFRGTPKFGLSTSIVDWRDLVLGWAVNADIFDEGTPAARVCAGFEGVVHRGYADLLGLLWPRLVRALATVGKDAPIWLTGHSQGGALATLTAGKLVDEGYDVRMVCTFGAPRAGDETFAQAYRPRVVRYERGDDIVPLLPPTRDVREVLNLLLEEEDGTASIQLGPTDFKHVGQLRFIYWDGRVGDPGWDLELRRAARVAKATFASDVRSRLWADHAMPGYLAALLFASDPGEVDRVDPQRAPDVERLTAIAGAAYQAALGAARPPAMQSLVDAIAELGAAGAVCQPAYDILAAVAQTQTQHLKGQLRADWDHVHQVAAWALGMLDDAQRELRGEPIALAPEVQARRHAHVALEPAAYAAEGKRLAEAVRASYAASLAPMQQLVDTLEEIALAGEGSASTYELLGAVATTQTGHLAGQLRDDWNYVRQAALWTIGMLCSAAAGRGVPFETLPAIRLVASILADSGSHPGEVACAAVQAMQCVARPHDVVFRALMMPALKSPYPDVRDLTQRVLAGEARPPAALAG